MDILMYENYHEKKEFADGVFPYNIYPCSIPVDFREVPVHWHEEMELISVKKGEGIISVDMEKKHVKAGDIAVIYPGQLHGIEQDQYKTMEYENIIFNLSMMMGGPTDICTTDYLFPLTTGTEQGFLYIPLEDKGYEKINLCIKNLDEICQNKLFGYELSIKGHLFQLLFELFTDYRSQVPGKVEKSKEKLKTVLKHIEFHYKERITVDDMAGLCYYSNSHFMKFFKKQMGTSFVEYLNDYRITMASRLLAATQDSVTSIAENTGFDNLSYFNRQFKKQLGETPSGYRKRKDKLSQTQVAIFDKN